MALVFDNCLIPEEFGANKIFADCCVNISCTITNNDNDIIIVNTEGIFQLGDMLFSDLLIDNAPPVYPFVVVKEQSFNLSFKVCPKVSGIIFDKLTIYFYDPISRYDFVFNFQTIPFESTIDISSINFGNIPINSSASQQINLINPTTECRFYDFSTSCPETILSEISMNLCQNDQGAFVVTWSPSAAGNINCDVVIETRCFNYTIPVTGSAIEPPTGGTTVPQKNKVDQTTRVEACSPRTANNRCQTARTMQSAIRTNARRFGKR